jgi:hypothetical protein
MRLGIAKMRQELYIQDRLEYKDGLDALVVKGENYDH